MDFKFGSILLSVRNYFVILEAMISLAFEVGVLSSGYEEEYSGVYGFSVSSG
jgi:hypothetical protein